MVLCGGEDHRLLIGMQMADRWLLQPGADVLFAGPLSIGERELLSASALPYVSPRSASAARVLARVAAYAPDVALFLGEQGAWSWGVAALALRTPLLVFEPNVVPSRASRMLGNFASSVAVCFRESRQFFPSGRAMVIGMPLSADLWQSRRRQGHERGGRLRVLVHDGIIGSRLLDRVLPQAFAQQPQLAEQVELWHLVGDGALEATQDAYQRQGLSARVERRADDWCAALDWAELVVSHAQATSCAQLAVAGVPCLLLPRPSSAGRHETMNAQMLAATGLASLLTPLSPKSLAASLMELLGNVDELRARRGRRLGFASPESAQRLFELIHFAEHLGAPRWWQSYRDLRALLSSSPKPQSKLDV
jgi:UDP-N-acetylglucosamine--N-acetylmuramyl-(pentapeptide) pyrophosphoryl-undecaprenol N-acetylglucosamine transferase